VAGAAAAWLARAAFLEAASVDAFRLLRRDLAALGAPRRLLRAASRAARDEKRHARRMRSLARRSGQTPPPASRVTATTLPTLEAMATENAVEGCVREAFGALIACYQAARATDRELAAAMRRIAVDEARHAALALRIDAWARPRLDRKARARMDLAHEEAVNELLHEMETSVAPRARLGLPDPCENLFLARAIFEGSPFARARRRPRV
jgi:hypothetical protein